MKYFNNPEAFIRLVLSMQDGMTATLTIFALTLVFSRWAWSSRSCA